MSKSETHNQDCLEAMRHLPDKAFDLAIVDPPYGIGMSAKSFNFRKPSVNSRHTGVASFTNMSEWDEAIPSDKYFAELLRVSRKQIIWGGNYFAAILPASSAWLVWFKNGQCMSPAAADCELAWTSFETAVRMFRFDWSGFGYINAGEDRIHPTQKPIALYKWLLTNYAKPGDTILDTHLGSGSSRIAAYDLGFDFTGYELDADYYAAQEKRFANHIAQPKLWEPTPIRETQGAIFATV